MIEFEFRNNSDGQTLIADSVFSISSIGLIVFFSFTFLTYFYSSTICKSWFIDCSPKSLSSNIIILLLFKNISCIFTFFLFFLSSYSFFFLFYFLLKIFQNLLDKWVLIFFILSKIFMFENVFIIVYIFNIAFYLFLSYFSCFWPYSFQFFINL